MVDLKKRKYLLEENKTFYKRTYFLLRHSIQIFSDSGRFYKSGL